MLRQGAATFGRVEAGDLGDRLRTVAAAGGQVVAGTAPILIEEGPQALFGGKGPVEDSLASGERCEFGFVQAGNR